jgi:hypothetical protein
VGELATGFAAGATAAGADAGTDVGGAETGTAGLTTGAFHWILNFSPACTRDTASYFLPHTLYCVIFLHLN